jgi:predicted flap endonuclease-1-like 5' DNA nuclease
MFVAVLLLVAAVLVAVDRAVESAPLADWWLPALLAIVGIGVAVYRAPAPAAPPSEEEAPRPPVREYLPPAQPPASLPASGETEATAEQITTEEATPAAPAKRVRKTAAKPQPEAQPETIATATTGKPDDLLRIDGIGPKIAAALQAAGIDSFQKLADTSEAQMLEILRAAKVRVVANYATWAQQAAFAVRGDWEGLDRFNRERKAEGGD